MLGNLISIALPVLLTLGGIFMVAPAIGWWRLMQYRQIRHSPLTKNLLRSPGHSLREKIEENDSDIDLAILLLVVTPLIVFSIHISQLYFGAKVESMSHLVTSILMTVGAGLFLGLKLIESLKKRRIHVLGLEGELATGEELNQLMLEGCRVFHDIPFPYGNIDHVVVSRSGVFCVNTKMVGKPVSGDGKERVVIDHTKNQIRFPGGRTWNIPNQQLEGEAKWLTEHLLKSVGEPIKVEPMLALPGWYIEERIGRGSVFVFNPNKPNRFFLNSRTLLSEKQISQVAHQLEQLIRDVKPSFKKEKKWQVKA